MHKSKAIKMAPGTLVLFADPGRKRLSYGERLGWDVRVTPRGGVLTQPVREVFG